MNIEPQNHEIYARIHAGFKEFLGIEAPDALHELERRVQIVSLEAGQILLRQGDPSDAIYLVLSGRLCAFLPGDKRRMLGEIGRGEMIGEMGVIQATTRSADVEALRDSQLLRIAAEDFHQLMQRHPHVAMPMMRSLLGRISSNNQKIERRRRVVNICLLPLPALGSDDHALDMQEMASQLAQAISMAHMGNPLQPPQAQQAGPTRVALQLPQNIPPVLLKSLQPGVAEGQASALQRDVLLMLENAEQQHDYQLLLAHPSDSSWTRICLRQADVVLLFARAGSSPALTDLEERYFQGQSPLVNKTTSLCLIHPPETLMPTGTRHWLESRPYLTGSEQNPKHSSHYHLRADHQADLQRLARIVSGNAIGLVLAGGGARGFVQAGVLQALEEAGVPWDMVGGTSMGAYIAGFAAMDQPVPKLQEYLVEGAMDNPTSDYNWLPVISIVRGKKRENQLVQTLHAFANVPPSHQLGLEDLWKPMFCVATNYSQVRMQVIRHGNLSDAILASSAIPAALPPEVRKGDLLIDGGIFNNYPVDVMYGQGAQYVIGVTMEQSDYRPVRFDRVPSPLTVLWDRWMRPKHKQRYRGLPSISTTVFRSVVMASIEHQRRMHTVADLSFNPTIKGVGMLDWGAVQTLCDVGLEHARQVLRSTGSQDRQ